MQRPIVSGMESMLHDDGTVVTKEGNLLQVRVHSELWNAESSDDLEPGDRVEVIDAKGLKLKVRSLRE